MALAARQPEPSAAVPRAWHEALAATRFVARRPDPEAAWRVACGMPSLDTGCRLVVGHFVNGKSDWHGCDAALAARVAARVTREG